jgi:uncharacterized membrane protein (UPF0127 family)
MSRPVLYEARFLPGHVTASLLLILAVATAMPSLHPAQPGRPGEPFPGPRGEVMLPSGKVLVVELADTPWERAIGYMYREKVTDGEGILFLFEENDLHSFWMKNCKVSLDLVWLDERWTAVHIERDVPPCTADPCPHYQPMQAARYVLETQAGLTGREKLGMGQRIIYMPPGGTGPASR